MPHTHNSSNSAKSYKSNHSVDSFHKPIDVNSSSSSIGTGYSATPFTGPRKVSPFKAVIVGAGVGGLIMALCLEKAGIDYVVLERAHQLQPPKSMIQLTANTLRVIEQLGLLEDIMRLSKPVAAVKLRKQNMSIVGKMDATWTKERYGHYFTILSRTGFCEVVLSRLPPNKVLWGRYVLEIVNGNAGVQCRCANGSVEQGDILIGADGAYSAVRQNLYRSLREKNLLPKTDLEPLKHCLNAIIGLTEPMDLERFPSAGAEFSEVNIVIGKDSPYTMWLTPAPNNTIAWCVGGELLTPEGSNETFKQSEFGPEAVDAACALIQDIELPGGGTIADMLENTRRDFITKVMVEEKHYKTWHHGRTVLIGEACHKFVPFSGQGAEQAILDVICLVNLLYRLPDHPSHLDFCSAFETYVNRRSTIAKDAVAASESMSHLMSSQGFTADFKRKIVFNLPEFMKFASFDKIQVRPILDFLEPVQDRGYKSVKIPRGVQKELKEKGILHL